ncbi:unnamed protein product [Blepharisma stoltei]|uniref:Uncharacterized protein n=1 Tax=Blepharisma stoltei TaxID=1481888 RepID=A0AAU9KM72_9CILI|nr:unnamed protein product [Blepharisma stoltei]
MLKSKSKTKRVPKLFLNQILTIASPYASSSKPTTKRHQDTVLMTKHPTLHRRIGSECIIRPATSKRKLSIPYSGSPQMLPKPKSAARIHSNKPINVLAPLNLHDKIKAFCEPEVNFPISPRSTAMNELAEYYEKKASLKIGKAVSQSPLKRREIKTNDDALDSLNLSPISIKDDITSFLLKSSAGSQPIEKYDKSFRKLIKVLGKASKS